MALYTNEMIDQLRWLNRELQLTRDVAILSLASLAETRDNETGAHILRTQRYVLALCRRLQARPEYATALDERTVELIYKSAPLHDIGKVGVPDAVLQKPGRLTDEEFAIMKRHPDLGRDALLAAERKFGETLFLRHAKDIAWTHHERWDGTGYPRGIAGADIPLSGRLMALADVYDALISRRVYKEAFPHAKSREIILAGRGTHFDPAVVDAFLAEEEEFQAHRGGVRGQPHRAARVALAGGGAAGSRARLSSRTVRRPRRAVARPGKITRIDRAGSGQRACSETGLAQISRAGSRSRASASRLSMSTVRARLPCSSWDTWAGVTPQAAATWARVRPRWLRITRRGGGTVQDGLGHLGRKDLFAAVGQALGKGGEGGGVAGVLGLADQLFVFLDGQHGKGRASVPFQDLGAHRYTSLRCAISVSRMTSRP